MFVRARRGDLDDPLKQLDGLWSVEGRRPAVKELEQIFLRGVVGTYLVGSPQCVRKKTIVSFGSEGFLPRHIHSV